MPAATRPQRPARWSAEARAIFDWVYGRIAYFKAPGWIAFVTELPTTATQKIQRGALRESAGKLPGTAGCFDLRNFKRREAAKEQS